jgi:hypothetical protein
MTERRSMYMLLLHKVLCSYIYTYGTPINILCATAIRMIKRYRNENI